MRSEVIDAADWQFSKFADYDLGQAVAQISIQATTTACPAVSSARATSTA